MLDKLFNTILLAGLIAAEVIRAPHRWRNRRDRRQRRIADARIDWQEVVLMLLGFAGLQALPVLTVLTRWPRWAERSLANRVHALAGLAGSVAAGGGLWLLWRAHADLGQNWSPTLETRQGHALVTHGVYGVIRHAIYAAVWLLALAQALLLRNWFAGVAGLLSFLPIYALRVPREERQMLDHFGEEYRAYMERAGRLLPRRPGQLQRRSWRLRPP